MARFAGDFGNIGADKVEFIDVSPKQMVGVSAGLIPFLEHDDANRALMGSNMQRQAVPLLITEPPIVSTGLEVDVARNSGMVVRSDINGFVRYVDAERIVLGVEKVKNEERAAAAEMEDVLKAALAHPTAANTDSASFTD